VSLPPVFFFAGEYLVPIFSFIAGIIVLTAFILWIGRPLYPALSRTSLGQWGAGVFARFVGSIPIFGGFLRDRGMADLCDFLAVALDSGVPLDIALTESAAAQPNILLRHRAAAWAGEISRGQPLGRAASAAGMPPLLIGMLPATTDSDSLAAVMRFLAGHFELRWLRAQAIIQSLYIPILVFTMGSAVAVIALSIFEPLSQLNQAAAHFPMGF
jgi:type II secretory pathway component PulF